MDYLLDLLGKLFAFGIADLFLLGLIACFLATAIFYKLSIGRQCAVLRAELAKLKRSVEQAAAKEKTARDELQSLLHSQNANMSRIDQLKRLKAEQNRKPAEMEKELEDLIAWCHGKSISVDFRRRQASRQAAPPGRKL